MKLTHLFAIGPPFLGSTNGNKLQLIILTTERVFCLKAFRLNISLIQLIAELKLLTV